MSPGANGRESSLAEVRAGVAERLRSQRTEIEEAIWRCVREMVPDPSGREDAEYLAGLRTAVTAAVDYGLMGIEQGERWSGPVPPAAVEQARRAARGGVHLETVLRRYALGDTLLRDFVVQAAEHSDLPGQKTALRDVLRGQASLLDQLMASVAGEYRRERERAGRSSEQRRTERVRKLLAGASADASGLDYDLDAWHLGVIATGAGAREAVQVLAESLGHRLLLVPYGEQTVWAWLGGRRRPEFTDIERLMPDMELEDLISAVGEPGAGVERWRLTHRQAQAALMVALRRPQRLTRYADVALLASVLQNDLVGRSLREIYLAPLDDPRDGPVLRETLRAYLAAGRNAATAAAALKVARHTVERRVRRVEQRLGRPLCACHVELEVALRLQALDAAGGGDRPVES